jgi:alpha-L-arabinofuranosidase
MSVVRDARAVGSLLLLVAGSAIALSQAGPATLEIQLQKPIAKVSPTLYGLMTEEINFSYDGGLYAEMVRNRTLHDNPNHPDRWYLVENGTSQASMEVDKSTGPGEALNLSLKIDVKQADPQNQAGVSNEGYWGYALRPNITYQGSLYAKTDSESLGPITVSLVSDNTGKSVASAQVSGVTTEWKRYEFTLKTGAIEASAANHLHLTVGHAGSLWLDLVSLFPPTYHDRANGNRIDLMEKLAAMKPSFLRFPGGNYLEGDQIFERYEWKTTLGPLVGRPTHPSPWRYHSSDGLGLLEFLEWCEDLHMQPVLAVYAGYSMHQEHINPGPALEPYLQDALDEIEYVSGSANTKWGGERAKDGHPEPFHLTYVEIGNEDWFDRSGSYDGRYAQFYKGIKQKYPDLQLIATMPVKSLKPDVVDDHYYRRATEFYSDTTHYDKSDRNGPKIFVGEWATREGTPTPNFGAALGDAAWMTGMERNSDLIIMAAYAPLLVNVNPGGMQWESDLIGYDAMSSYGSPSYYAQVLFDSYLGTEIPNSELNGAHPRVFYSVTHDPAQGMVYLKLVNASSTEQPVNIKLDGTTKVDKDADLISLSAHSTEETNTLVDPNRIIPVKSILHDSSTSFQHALPPYSIQVLVLKAK